MTFISPVPEDLHLNELASLNLEYKYVNVTFKHMVNTMILKKIKGLKSISLYFVKCDTIVKLFPLSTCKIQVLLVTHQTTDKQTGTFDIDSDQLSSVDIPFVHFFDNLQWLPYLTLSFTFGLLLKNTEP